MSISQLCQQDASDDEHHRDLDQDPFELNSDDEGHHHTTNGNSNGNGYHTNGIGNGHHHTNGGGAHYSNSSDEFEEFDDRPRSSSSSSRPDPDEQLAAEALGDMANSIPSAAPTAPFISRMSSLPIVNSPLKAYESGKQNSKVMKVTI
jgi:hypothetical protein